MVHVAGPTAALTGVPGGLQSQGVWAGRRQLFVRFAAEAETATMYTADALMNELKRSIGRSRFHSVSIGGRDPLANIEYLCAAFAKWSPPLPVMLDTDGQRPPAIAEIRPYVSLVQVTLEGAMSDDVHVQQGLESLRTAASGGTEHALVLCPTEHTSDAQILRVVEQAHGVTEDVAMVVHPPANVPIDRDRRWSVLIDRALALHGDIRLALRIPPPTGMR